MVRIPVETKDVQVIDIKSKPKDIKSKDGKSIVSPDDLSQDILDYLQQKSDNGDTTDASYLDIIVAFQDKYGVLDPIDIKNVCLNLLDQGKVENVQ
jgi:hypothetical protein